MRSIATASGLALLLASTVTYAADAPPAAPAPAAKAPMPQDAMAAYQKAAAVGEEHKKLEAFTGSFSCKVKYWSNPKAQPVESTGTSEAKLVLGGRYLQQTFDGTMMGQPFHGLGYTGYDNMKKLYVSAWMDDMSTDLMYTNGKWDPTGTVLQSVGKVEDPVSGKPKSIRTQVRTKVEGAAYVWEMWEPDAAGNFFKTMEVAYTKM